MTPFGGGFHRDAPLRAAKGSAGSSAMCGGRRCRACRPDRPAGTDGPSPQGLTSPSSSTPPASGRRGRGTGPQCPRRHGWGRRASCGRDSDRAAERAEDGADHRRDGPAGEEVTAVDGGNDQDGVPDPQAARPQRSTRPGSRGSYAASMLWQRSVKGGPVARGAAPESPVDVRGTRSPTGAAVQGIDRGVRDGPRPLLVPPSRR